MQSANPNVSWTGSQKLYDWSPRLYELPPLNRQDWILMNARTESQWMSGLNLNKCPDWIPLNVRTESQWMSGLNPNNCQKGIKRKRWLNLRIKVITAKHHWINNDFNDYKLESKWKSFSIRVFPHSIKNPVFKLPASVASVTTVCNCKRLKVKTKYK